MKSYQNSMTRRFAEIDYKAASQEDFNNIVREFRELLDSVCCTCRYAERRYMARRYR